MKEEIISIIKGCISSINDELNFPEFENPDKDTYIHGARSSLDSINLVSLIVEIEEKIAESFDKTITIADEKAMSMARSPFRTVSTLADFIETKLESEDE